MPNLNPYIQPHNDLAQIAANEPIEKPPMKLYHKNTDIEVKVGDMFHLNGMDCEYKYYTGIDCRLYVPVHDGFRYRQPETIGLEWR